MKQSTKICLIAAIVLIVVGGILFVGSMRTENWSLGVLGGGNFETRTWDIEGEFHDISINTDTADIRFVPAENGKCSVVIRESEKQRHTVAAESGTLRIQAVDSREWLDHVTLFSTETPSVTVYLPRTEYAALSINESTGDVDIPADFRFETIDVVASTGDVRCLASASGPVRVRLSTGDIRMEHIAAAALDLSVSTGRIDVASADCGGDVGVVVSTGRTTLTDVNCSSVTSAGSTGTMTLQNVVADGLISIQRSTGDVKLENCDAGELYIKTDTGDVTGTLRSEKIFMAKSDTGHIEVPRTTTGGVCEITTDTGDIRIEIN